jgi:ribosomal protein S7
MALRLANEVLAAAKEEGAAVKKRPRYSQNGRSK